MDQGHLKIIPYFSHSAFNIVCLHRFVDLLSARILCREGLVKSRHEDNEDEEMEPDLGLTPPSA